MESVLHANDVLSGHTTDTTKVPAQKLHNYRSDRWIALKCFSRVFGGYFTWNSVESVLHNDDVRSGHTADTTRVPAQKVYNYRFDRWIALKFFHVFVGCFTWSSVEMVLNFDNDVRSFHTTDTTRIPAQNMHNYRSDRWIAVMFFSLVYGGCFTLRSVESVLQAADVRLGHTTDTPRLPAQKVHNYRSDRRIALKFFSSSFRKLFFME